MAKSLIYAAITITPTKTEQAMRVLLIGSGGREHALAWKLSASPSLTRLYCAPGNPGIATVAELVDIGVDDHQALIAFAKDKQIDLVVVGPEAPLVTGLSDEMRAEGIRVFGPPRLQRSLKDLRVLPRISARASIFRRALMAVSTMRRRPRLISDSRVRPSSSRPTGLPQARAWLLR